MFFHNTWENGLGPSELLKDLFSCLNEPRLNQLSGKKKKWTKEKKKTCGLLTGPRPAGCGPNDFLRYAKNNRSLISLSTHIRHTCAHTRTIARTHLSNPLLFDTPFQAYLQLSIFSFC